VVVKRPVKIRQIRTSKAFTNKRFDETHTNWGTTNETLVAVWSRQRVHFS